jgi:hypothetical protein
LSISAAKWNAARPRSSAKVLPILLTLPNVKDEPRRRLARSVRQHDP